MIMFRWMIAGIAFIMTTFTRCDALPFLRTDTDFQEIGPSDRPPVTMTVELSGDNVHSKVRMTGQLLESGEHILVPVIRNEVFSEESQFNSGHKNNIAKDLTVLFNGRSDLDKPEQVIESIVNDNLVINMHIPRLDKAENGQPPSNENQINLEQKNTKTNEVSTSVNVHESAKSKRDISAKFAEVDSREDGYRSRSKRQISDIRLLQCLNTPGCREKLEKIYQFRIEQGMPDIAGTWHV